MPDQYKSLYESFRWLVPTNFNIGHECCHRWANSSADARRIALFFEDETGRREVWTYERIAATANQLSNGLIRMGVQRGDRVSAYLPNTPEAVIAFLATASLGAIWSVCAPDMAVPAIVDRFRQIEPKVLIAADGVHYAGKPIDRSAPGAGLRAELP
ncbi:MAG: AMP-binding protein, partial [Burkholderiales bacterium]